MPDSLLTGLPMASRARQMLEGKAMNAAAMAPVIQGLMEQVDAANARADKEAGRAESEHVARMSAENDRAAAVRAQADAEGVVIKERAAREAAEAKLQEADARATQMKSMYEAECQECEALEEKNAALLGRLATAEAEARVAKEEIARMKREKPVTTSRPAAYDVAWVDREGKPRSMTVTPRS